MRKNVWKRCLAMALSATILFTSVDVSWANTGSGTTKTQGEIVAEYYQNNGTIKASEAAVLSHADLKANETVYSFDFTEEKLKENVKLDVNTKTVEAGSYEKDGVTWNAKFATVIFADENTANEEATQDNGLFKYTGTETVKEVKVSYEPSVEISQEAQVELLNSVNNIYWGVDAIQTVYGDSELGELAKTIQTSIDNVDKALTLGGAYIEEEMKTAIAEPLGVLKANFKLGKLFDEYENSTDDVVFWAKNAKATEDSITKSYDAIKTLAESTFLTGLADKFLEANKVSPNEDFVKAANAIKNSYIPAYQGFVNNQSVNDAMNGEIDFASDKTTLIVENPVGGIALPKRVGTYAAEEGKTIFTVPEETATVTVTANNRIVTVDVKVEVVKENKSESLPLKTANVVVELGASHEDVLTAISDVIETKLTELDEDSVFAITEKNTSVYDLKYYDCKVEPSVGAEGVTDNMTLTVTYEPKTYDVTCSDNVELVSGNKAPYGFIITFPSYEGDAAYAYEYTVDGHSYYQGSTYMVTGNAAFTREKNLAQNSKTINELVAENHADELSDDEKAILKSTALKTEKLTARVPNVDAISISQDGKTISVKPYADGLGNNWNATKILVKNGDAVLQTITEFPEGEASIDEAHVAEYTSVEVTYGLKVDKDTQEVIEILNTPYELSVEVKKQMADMEKLVNNQSNLTKVTAVLLNTVVGQLNTYAQKQDTPAEDAERAVKIANDFTTMSANVFDGNGDLKLLGYIKAYADLEKDLDKLNYYYANQAAISSAYEYLAEQLVKIVTEDNMKVISAALPAYESELKALPDARDKIVSLAEGGNFLTTRNSKILTNGDTDTLLSGLIGLNVAKKHESANELYWTTTFSKNAATAYTVTYVVEQYNGDGVVVATDKYEISKKKTDALDDGAVTDLKTKAEAIRETLLGEGKYAKGYYTVRREGALAEAGCVTDTTVTFKYEPSVYTVTVNGEAQESKYGNIKITLPAPTVEDQKYTYTVGTKTYSVEYGKEPVVITITEDSELDALFGTGKTYIVEKTISSIANEKLNTLFDKINAGFDKDQNKNLTTAALIPYTKEANVEAAVLRVTDMGDNSSIMNSLMSMVQNLILEGGYSYIGIGGNEFYTDKASIQTIVEALLDSGIGTESLTAMFAEDGSINNNTNPGNDYVVGTTSTDEYIIPEAAQLGAQVLATTLELGSDSANAKSLKFIVSYQDFEQSADDKLNRKELRDSLVELEKVAEIKCENGEVVITIKEPISKEAYEAYLVAMILEGRTDFASINTVTLADMMDYEYEDRLGTVIQDKNVTYQTLENTLTKLGVNTNVDEYSNIIEKALKVVRDETIIKLERGPKENLERDEYRMSGSAPSVKLVEKMNVDQQYASLIKEEDVAIPVKVVVKGIGEEYAALFINDSSALQNVTGADKNTLNIAKEALTLVKAEELSDAATKAENSMIIMLKDVSIDLTFNSKTVLDLNGHKVRKVTGTNGTVALVDSTYGNNGTATVGENVKDVRFNDFFSTSADNEGNVTVTLDAGFLAEAAEAKMPEAKLLAVEIAFDVIMNNLTSGKMSINGNDIYGIDFKDAFALIEAGGTNAVNELLDSVKYNGLSAFINDILAALTNFNDLAADVKEEKAIASYTAITNPLKVEFAVNDDENYITMNLTTASTQKQTTVTVIVGGDEGEKAELAKLCEELGSVVTVRKLETGLEDIDYTDGSVKVKGASASADIEVDLTKDINYPIVFAMIVANGQENKEVLVNAINDYLAVNIEDKKEVKAAQEKLKEAVEAVTTKDVINAVKAANGKAFDSILNNLGIDGAKTGADELEATYHDLLSVLYRVSAIVANRLDITGGNQALGNTEDSYGVYGGKVDGTYRGVKIDANLSLKLFKEIVIEPDKTKPDLTAEAEKDYVNTDNVIVTGKATDSGSGIDIVSVYLGENEVALGTVTLEEDGSFTYKVSGLAEGQNKIIVVAKDKEGNETRKTLTVTRDSVAPEIIKLDTSVTAKEHKVTISGTAEDVLSGMDYVIVNGDPELKIPGGAFKYDVKLQSGKNTITITAVDKAGNKATKEITVYCNTVGAKIDVVGDKATVSIDPKAINSEIISVEINGKSVALEDGLYSTVINLKKGENFIGIVIRDKEGNIYVTTYTYKVSSGSDSSSGSGSDSGSNSDSKENYVEIYHPQGTPEIVPSVPTGDTNNIMLWVAVMGIAFVAVVTAITVKKKKVNK